MREAVDGLVQFFVAGKELRVLALVIGFIIWIAGMIYCERVADEQRWNEWTARIVGAVLPGLGPFVYWLRRREARKHRHYTRRPRVT